MVVANEQTSMSQARAKLAGPSGFQGIVSNGKTFGIAMFAAVGGLVYGCMY